MPTNEEGEFELILGNKQLLSVFFIVVILLGVFFTMGYVVGRNSAPVEATARPIDVPANSRPGASQIVVDPSGKSADATPTTSIPPPGVTSPEPKPEPLREASIPVAAAGGLLMPQPGEMYVQVLALAKPEAEVLVDVLAKKGFRASVAPGPNDRLFRVLVGPARDNVELAKLRNDVEAAGFKGAFTKKY